MECVAAVLTRDSTNNDRVPVGLGRQWLEAAAKVARAIDRSACSEACTWYQPSLSLVPPFILRPLNSFEA